MKVSSRYNTNIYLGFPVWILIFSMPLIAMMNDVRDQVNASGNIMEKTVVSCYDWRMRQMMDTDNKS